MSRSHRDQRKHRRKAWRNGRGKLEHAKRDQRQGTTRAHSPHDRNGKETT